eukprot:TRINITY_DN21702_c0_g1_i2.p2 TRINITY_DN21702_c0_g1~~TRINITY_DN21702_c0_g1_i2.p2  ORF type:complete len:164 (+),score=36.20 TRINITY_DN21702_c0_g1_i2:138-629(+)
MEQTAAEHFLGFLAFFGGKDEFDASRHTAEPLQAGGMSVGRMQPRTPYGKPTDWCVRDPADATNNVAEGCWKVSEVGAMLRQMSDRADRLLPHPAAVARRSGRMPLLGYIVGELASKLEDWANAREEQQLRPPVQGPARHGAPGLNAWAAPFTAAAAGPAPLQ